MKYFHLKLAIGIIVVFGLLLLGFALWIPIKVQYYAWQYRSPDVAARVKAVDVLIKLGEPGTAKLKAIYPDGQKAAEMLIECWDNPGQMIEDRNKAFALLKLGKGWEVEPGRYTPLSYQHVAAFNGYLETVKLLMQKGCSNDCHCDLGIRKPEGKGKGKSGYTYNSISGTPIHAASVTGRNYVIEYMLSQGIDVNAKNTFSETPLHLAAMRGQTATADFLISRGAEVNSKDIYDWTPLHKTAKHGQTATAEFLISKGADVNAKENAFGQTPLHWAAEGGYTKTVALLISEGADVNARDDEGETALDQAMREKHKETEKLLRAHGAKTAEELKAGAGK